MELYGNYLLASTKEQEINSFNSKYCDIDRDTDLYMFFNDFWNILIKKAPEFTEMGSGWALFKQLFL